MQPSETALSSSLRAQAVRYPERDADVAQSVEHQLPKLRVAGSIPVVRFEKPPHVGGFRIQGANGLRNLVPSLSQIRASVVNDP